ncbi:hypothetical protein LXL04_019923 [Taraxacum kok-saghyz]
MHICKVFGKKKSFFRKFFFATGLIFERFLAPRSRFFEKVNGLGVLGTNATSWIESDLQLASYYRFNNFTGIRALRLAPRDVNNADMHGLAIPPIIYLILTYVVHTTL